MKYVHQPLNKEVGAVAGYYCPQKEVRMDYEGREVLYVLGQVNVEASCCGVGCWVYAQVPGIILKWHSEQNEAGLPVSEIEPVADSETQSKMSQIIKEKEKVSRVDFS